MSIVSSIISAIADIHCCVSSNIISCCATCFTQIEMFLIQCYNSMVSGLPSYLQRSCDMPTYLGKHFSKPTKLKIKFFCLLCETIFVEEFALSLKEAQKVHYFCFPLLVQRSAVQQKSSKATLPSTKSFFYCKTRVVRTIAMFIASQ